MEMIKCRGVTDVQVYRRCRSVQVYRCTGDNEIRRIGLSVMDVTMIGEIRRIGLGVIDVTRIVEIRRIRISVQKIK